MRFLLKPSRPAVAKPSRLLAAASEKAAASPPSVSAAKSANASAGKAWGQQCSPDCGCVLRIETQLSKCSSALSPTIVSASYHTKRVMATFREPGGGARRLRPLTTQHAARPPRPILTSCTCPTLHQLARQTVDYLPGKTLAQMRNEIDMGTVGSRSSVAFRHTVLRRLPVAVESTGAKLGMNKISSARRDKPEIDTEGTKIGVHEMNDTHRRGHCYDLVEDSLMSMIHGRAPSPRRDGPAESYSPTLGESFPLYSRSGRNKPADADDARRDESVTVRENESPSFREGGYWRRSSPPSYSLFGERESKRYSSGSSSDSLNIARQFIHHTKELIANQIFGHGARSPAADGRPRAKGTVKQPAMDDWLDYVDQMQDPHVPPRVA